MVSECDNKDIDKINQIPIPKFDAVISNFPFIQQEDIPNEILNTQFESEFAKRKTLSRHRGIDQ